MNEKWKNFAHEMLVVGTPECAVFSGAAAMVLALLDARPGRSGRILRRLTPTLLPKAEKGAGHEET